MNTKSISNRIAVSIATLTVGFSGPSRLAAQALYKATASEKIQSLYRGLLMRAAKDLPPENNRLNLCVEFQSDKTARNLIQRAKSILAADASFFSVNSPHARIRGEEVLERLCHRFVEEMLTAEPGEVLLLRDAYTAFSAYLKHQNQEPVKRSDFKGVIVPLVRDQFNVCLRNDFKINEGSGGRGWKDVRYAGRTVPG